MRNNRHGKTRSRFGAFGRRRGFSLSELMVVVAIISLVLGVAVPSIVVAVKDVELKQAKASIYAALEKAHSRALSERRMVALHVFYDRGQVYQGNYFRWGHAWDPISSTWSDASNPHIATNKMTMRLEVARWGDSGSGSVEFVWPNDHDPIILPDKIGVCRPSTDLGYYVDASAEMGASAGTVKLPFSHDFYIVFAEDGKLTSVLVDYNCYFDTTTPANNPVTTSVFNSSGTLVSSTGTWSATGLCIYDMTTFKGQPTVAAQQAYVNRSDNQVLISPYTGMPLSMEVSK